MSQASAPIENSAPIEKPPPWISDSSICYIFGAVSLALGFFASFIGAPVAGFSSSLAMLGAVLLVIGLLLKIERRLIDLERAILSFREPPQP